LAACVTSEWEKLTSGKDVRNAGAAGDDSLPLSQSDWHWHGTVFGGRGLDCQNGKLGSWFWTSRSKNF